MTQEALRMALEALKDVGVLTDREWQAVHKNKANELRQAIAELESQEPRNVRERWNVEFDGNDLLVCFNDHEKGDKCQYERYSQQRTWVGLTLDEIALLHANYPNPQGFALALQAKLKEKNT